MCNQTANTIVLSSNSSDPTLAVPEDILSSFAVTTSYLDPTKVTPLTVTIQSYAKDSNGNIFAIDVGTFSKVAVQMKNLTLGQVREKSNLKLNKAPLGNFMLGSLAGNITLNLSPIVEDIVTGSSIQLDFSDNFQATTFNGSDVTCTTVIGTTKFSEKAVLLNSADLVATGRSKLSVLISKVFLTKSIKNGTSF